MPDDILPERQGPGRREQDSNCKDHDERLDKVERILDRQYGWIKAAGAFLAIIMPLVGWLGLSIQSRLTTIIDMQSNGRVVTAEMQRDIRDHDNRLRDIEDRHKFLDQNGVVKKVK